MKKFIKYLLRIVVVFVILFFVYKTWEWYIGTHYLKFDLNKKYYIELTADEITEAFLDWPIEYEITIKNIETNSTYIYTFFTGEGPYLEFYTSEEFPDQILIKGYGHNSICWSFDINKTEPEQSCQEENFGSFKKQIRLNENFEIEKTN